MSSTTSGFYLTVTGELAGAKMNGVDDLYCKYSLNYGVDWNILNGLEHGITQISRKPVGTSDQTFTWNYPLDVTFRSTNAFGWPQIVVTVYSINAMGKDVVRGYGCIHLPTTPGRHVRYLRLYSPVSSSMCQRLMSWIMGNPPEFFNAKFIAQGKGREVTRVRSSGTVKFVFNVATKHLTDWGYEVAGDRSSMPTSASSSSSLFQSVVNDSADYRFGNISNTGSLRSNRNVDPSASNTNDLKTNELRNRNAGMNNPSGSGSSRLANQGDLTVTVPSSMSPLTASTLIQ